MEEINKLKLALCEYARDKDDPLETLTLLCSKSKNELKEAGLLKAWPAIAECLPNRSVQSCHNVCRRKFNPDNYQGKWSQEDEAQLLHLVRQLGNQWKEITERLNQSSGNRRTRENVKDKYK